MSIKDFGWVYHHPDKPPAKCSCGQDLMHMLVVDVHVCPKCDCTHLWPNLGFDNTPIEA